MIDLGSMFEWGRRALVPKGPAALGHPRGPLLALARWPIVPSADKLFARASECGLGERLSRLVQRKALRCGAAWEGALRGLRLSINLLPEDISRDGFDDWLLDEMATAGIEPGRVTVEITENALLVDKEAVCERLTRLR